MDTDVYLLCPVCKTITDGTGSGDSTDSIFCKKCKNEFKAVYSFKYHKYHINEEGFLSYNGKRLYIPCEIKIC